MARAQHGFADVQGLLVEGPSSGVVPLRLQQQGQVVQALSGVGVALAQDGLAEGQGLLVEGPGPGVVPLRGEQMGQVVQA